MSNASTPIKQGINEFIEEMIKLFFERLMQKRQEINLYQLHRLQMEVMEKQLSSVLKQQNLTLERKGNTYSFDRLEKGRLVFQKDGKEIRLSPRAWTQYQQKQKLIQQRQTPSKKSPRLDPSYMRGKLEANQHLQKASPQTIVITLQTAVQKAQREQRPLQVSYYQTLHQQIDQAVLSSRGQLLSQADHIHQNIGNAKREIHEVKEQIMAEKNQLQDAKSEMSPAEFALEQQMLDRKADRVAEQWIELREIEDDVEDMVKHELQTQYPELKVDNLSLKESLDIAKVAQQVPDKDQLHHLREYAEKNQLDHVNDSLDKATESEEIWEETIEDSVYDRY